MEIRPGTHLSYCTNIHPGLGEAEVRKNLSKVLPSLKRRLAPQQHFGVGLRLAAEAAYELAKSTEKLKLWQDWLESEGLYVFTVNGFPYGPFHGQQVKEGVHRPDWTTPERYHYTANLAEVVAELAPRGLEPGISTSPLSYKFWHRDAQRKHEVRKACARNMGRLVKVFLRLEEEKGVLVHLDLEPEPDGFLETGQETIAFFEADLLHDGAQLAAQETGLSLAECQEKMLRYFRVCYDVCHFSVAYDDHQQAIRAFEQKGIGIGKIQISAALKLGFDLAPAEMEKALDQLAEFEEPVYLHQTWAYDRRGNLKKFPDLGDALSLAYSNDWREWRTHYHVPIFMEHYGLLNSTQEGIREVLDYWKTHPFTPHLEVETYTWGVLPEGLQLSLEENLARELEWVQVYLKQ